MRGSETSVAAVLGLVAFVGWSRGPAASPAGRHPGAGGEPVPRWTHSAAVVDGRIYVVGGAGADNKPLASMEAYDPDTGAWEVRASMPTARALLGVGALGKTLYAIGGSTMGLDGLSVVEAYDTATDTWTRKADLPTGRNALCAVAVGGRLYAIGGMAFERPKDGWESVDPTSGGREFATVEAYDPATDTWTARASMPTARAGVAAGALGGKIYVFGGASRRGDEDVVSSALEVYDTATNRWAPGPPMPTARCFPATGVIDGWIFVAGGTTASGSARSQVERMRQRTPLSVVEAYDPAAGQWTTETSLATARGWLSGSVVDGRLYLVGGRAPAPEGGILEVDGAIPGVEAYTPASRPRN
jgi:N-acetylneuraminic acid mutarotase